MRRENVNVGCEDSNPLWNRPHARAALDHVSGEKRQFTPARVSTAVPPNWPSPLSTGIHEPHIGQTTVYQSYDKSHKVEADREIL